MDKIKLQEEIDSANNTLSSNKNVEGDNDDNIIGENQTEDVLSPNDINIGSSYSKSVRRSSHKFGSRLRFFRRTSAAVQGANLEDEELQASQKKQELLRLQIVIMTMKAEVVLLQEETLLEVY